MAEGERVEFDEVVKPGSDFGSALSADSLDNVELSLPVPGAGGEDQPEVTQDPEPKQPQLHVDAACGTHAK